MRRLCMYTICQEKCRGGKKCHLLCHYIHSTKLNSDTESNEIVNLSLHWSADVICLRSINICSINILSYFSMSPFHNIKNSLV